MKMDVLRFSKMVTTNQVFKESSNILKHFFYVFESENYQLNFTVREIV